MAQPPQAPKYRQNGAIRSALACSTREQTPAVGMTGDRFGLDGLAASVYGTNTVWPPAKATPSPRWPT